MGPESWMLPSAGHPPNAGRRRTEPTVGQARNRAATRRQLPARLVSRGEATSVDRVAIRLQGSCAQSRKVSP